MKKYLKMALRITVTVFCFAAVATALTLITGSFPPQDSFAQKELPPDKRADHITPDSILYYNQMVKHDSARLAAYIQGQKDARKAITKKSKHRVKVVEKEVPVLVAATPDTVVKETIRTIYTASPVYKNNEVKYLNFSEWRKQTGKSSEKEYKQYLKDLKVQQ